MNNFQKALLTAIFFSVVGIVTGLSNTFLQTQQGVCNGSLCLNRHQDLTWYRWSLSQESLCPCDKLEFGLNDLMMNYFLHIGIPFTLGFVVAYGKDQIKQLFHKPTF